MASFGQAGFNANDVDPVDFNPLPAGKYLAAIIKSEMAPTKKNDGQFLKLTFQVLEGQYKGRQLFDRLNLQNPNSEAVRIARGQLSSLCRAVGVMTPKDSQELHDVPLLIDVRCSKREDTGDIGNEIKGYHKRDAAAGTASGATGSTATTGSAGAGVAPWKR